jgi:hypothetical protein
LVDALHDGSQVVLDFGDHRRIARRAGAALARVSEVVGADLDLGQVRPLEVVDDLRVVGELLDDVLGRVAADRVVVDRDVANPERGQARSAQLRVRRASASRTGRHGVAEGHDRMGTAVGQGTVLGWAGLRR